MIEYYAYAYRLEPRDSMLKSNCVFRSVDNSYIVIGGGRIVLECCLQQFGVGHYLVTPWFAVKGS